MNEMGTAASPAQEAVEAAIRDVAPWQGLHVRYEPVLGGISNSNFRIAVEGFVHDFFLKIPGTGTEMFVDRNAARAASKQAELIGIGPKTFDYLDDQHIEISEFITNRRPSTNQDFADATIRKNVVDVYRRFHEAPLLPLTKTIFDMAEEHFEQLRTLGGYQPLDFSWLYRQFQQAKDAFSASGLDIVACFNDPMPGNFMLAADKSVMLVDFEHASNNERLYDLALWSLEMFLPEDIECEIIEHYYGHYNRRLHARFIVLKAVADIKWGTWAMIQNRLSDLPFDFYKYGIWKYMRARSTIHDKRWPEFLKIL